ncbi:hypothetical protein OG252_24575 [Streptomyces sp. NBC_01352]|uniref:hypothetical protein n=1 Tax=Streptomyces sp. NBC_01352 TaxID=2903834 RepID=UPI002E2F9ED6|nr:hypothetical protein [Streptomyces sp. NBC_01352]
MIGDSMPWREDLLRIAERLEKRKVQKRWTERTTYLVERDIALGAFIVRRLNESRKVSDSLAARNFPVERFSLVGEVPDVYNRHEFYELYDLERGAADTLSFSHLCNQIIHSYVWHFSVTEDSGMLDGVYVCSDHKRRKTLYKIPLDSLIDLFVRVGTEDIYRIDIRADSNGERYVAHVEGRSLLDGIRAD